MAEEAIVPGENPAPPAAPAAPAVPADPPAPNGSEPDNNPGGEPAMVPSDRLREETEKRRKAEEELEELKKSQTQPPVQPSQDDDIELEPDTERLLDSYAKKRGLVSKEELDNQAVETQVKQDIRDLESNPPNPGIPYDHQEVMKFAKDNDLPATSKAALRAAYRELNYDKIVEAEHQKAIDGYQIAGASGAEKPGGGASVPSSEPELTGKTPKERRRERIAAARQRLQI